MTPPFEPWLSPLRVRDLLKSCVDRAQPASMVRLGDGEFPILGYPAEAPWEHTANALGSWFGHAGQPPALIASFADALRAAVRAADIVGVPRGSLHHEERLTYVDAVFARHGLAVPGQVYVDHGVHHFLQFLLAYGELLRGLPFLGVISGRDVSARLRSAFAIGEVGFYPIPAEPALPGPFAHLAPHFPDRFEALRRELAVPSRGAVFLVGAGALGKIYCHWIKERGGIALDVGSLLDAWDGTVSRRRISRHRELFELEAYARHRDLDAGARLVRYREILRSGVFNVPPSPRELAALIDENYA